MSTLSNGNVVPIRERAKRASAGQAEAAQYLCQMTLELEQLANTAGLELAAYFLAMARSEAAAFAHAPAAPGEAPAPQTPYRAD